MDPQEVNDLFVQMDDVLLAAVFRVVESCREWACDFLLGEVEAVLVGSTHGRLIYVKNGDRRSDEARFAASGARLMNLLTYRSIDILRPVLRHALLDSGYVRVVLDALLERFCRATERYPDVVAGVAKAHAMQHRHEPGRNLQHAMASYPRLDRRARQIEAALGAEREALRAAVRDVQYLRRRYLQIREPILWSYARIVYREAIDRAAQNQHDQILENFQNGCGGLMRAILCYNHARNVHFGSYARGWVRQGILYWIKEQSGVINLPAVVWQSHAKLEELRARHYARTGRDEMPAELAYRSDRVQAIEESVRVGQVSSLQQRVGPNQNMTIEGAIGDDSFLDAMHDSEQDDRLTRALASLSQQHRHTLLLHYGLLNLLEDRQDVTDSMLEEERLRQISGA